jgi:peptidoglycan/xylan/chitin deacetylase (PgdA/CDA1 family)
MKIIKKIVLAATFLAVIFCLVWLWRPGYTVPVLTYHSINYEDSLISVTPESFDRQLSYIKAKGYKVISLAELVEGIKSNKRFNRKTVVITFDDGRKDNYTYGLATLKKYRFPVMIFLAANEVNNKPDFLTWDEVRAMMIYNVSFGAHTKNHVYLGSIGSDETLRDEIVGSKELIEKNINAPVQHFSYPYGAFNENVKRIVKESGYKGACTTNIGSGRFNEDIYAIKRIRVKNSDTIKPFHFWAKLSGYYNLFRRPRLEVGP